MNPNFPTQLAEKLTANPALFDDMDESLLGDVVFHYHRGELNADDTAKVAAMIQMNPMAQAIHQRILDAEKYASSENGKAWLDGMFDRVLDSSLPLTKNGRSVPLTPCEDDPPTLAHSPSPLRSKFFKRATLNQPSLWTRIKALFGLGDDTFVPMGYARADNSTMPEYMSHLEDHVMSRLWKDETRGWVLSLLTDDQAFTRLSYQFEGAEAKTVHLESLAGDSFRFETSLDASTPPSVHPQVACAGQ